MTTPAPAIPGGITVSAVREQLVQLGHGEVSDDVIANFLSQLSLEVRAPARAETHAESATEPEEEAPRVDAVRLRVPTTPGAAPPDASPANATTPASASTKTPSSSRLVTPPRATPARPSSCSRAAAPRSTPRTAPRSAPRSTPRTAPRSAPPPRRPASASKLGGTAPRFGYSLATPSASDLAPLASGATRPVGAAFDAFATKQTLLRSSKKGGSQKGGGGGVIRAPLMLRPGAPGQTRVIDRVARNAHYRAAWRGGGGEDDDPRARRPRVNFAAAFAEAHAREEKAARRARDAARRCGSAGGCGKMTNRPTWDANGRREVKKTQHFGETEALVENPSPERGGGERGAPREAEVEWTTPDAKRRDRLRWEVRRWMTEAPR